MIRTASLLHRSRDAARARISGGNDDGIALLSAIVFMIVMAGLAVVLLSVIMAQLVPAATAQKRTQTVNAAEAGLEATLGIIRSTARLPNAALKVYGDITDLPCTVTGKVDGSSAATTYTATVRYYVSDPANQPETWLTSNKMACSAATGVASQPLYALITSKGDGGGIQGVSGANAGNRSVSAVYQFKVTNSNIPGGRIYDSTNRYCLEAVTAAAGSLVKFVSAANCTNDPLQLWSYGDDYQLKLASTVTPTNLGFCITGPVNDGEGNQDVKLAACKAKTDIARWNQLFGWTGDYSWRGQQKTITNGQSNYCLSPGAGDGSNFTGVAMQVRTSCMGTFLPSAKVGAGAAGYSLTAPQIVNYKEFGRCADVTNEQIGYSYMISYPCKQDPSGTGTKLVWNHKWFYTEPTLPATRKNDQQIYVYNGGDTNKKFCLETPSTSSGSIYPTFQTCRNNNYDNQKWDRVMNSGNYSTSYLFTDNYGRCLSTDPRQLHSGFSRISVLACDGTTAQKWNAPANPSTSEVGGYRETAP